MIVGLLLACSPSLSIVMLADGMKNVFAHFSFSPHGIKSTFFMLSLRMPFCLLGGHTQGAMEGEDVGGTDEVSLNSLTHTHSTAATFRKLRNESEMFNINNSARPWARHATTCERIPIALHHDGAEKSQEESFP